MTSSSSDVVDVNDAFEKLLFAEDLIEKSAYEKGYDLGKKQMFDGYHLGYHRASSLAAQLGYYFGILLYIQQTATLPRINDQVIKLIKEIESFPCNNDDEKFDTIFRFDTIKFNVKKLCSIVKIDSKYPQSNKTDF